MIFIQLTQVDEQGTYSGEFYTFALAGFIRQRGESDACHLALKQLGPRGIVCQSFWNQIFLGNNLCQFANFDIKMAWLRIGFYMFLLIMAHLFGICSWTWLADGACGSFDQVDTLDWEKPRLRFVEWFVASGNLEDLSSLFWVHHGFQILAPPFALNIYWLIVVQLSYQINEPEHVHFRPGLNRLLFATCWS